MLYCESLIDVDLGRTNEHSAGWLHSRLDVSQDLNTLGIHPVVAGLISVSDTTWQLRRIHTGSNEAVMNSEMR
jgi:hypothetical protein